MIINNITGYLSKPTPKTKACICFKIYLLYVARDLSRSKEEEEATAASQRQIRQ